MEDEQAELVSGILFCPVCCSNVDVVAPNFSVQEFECESCQQTWTMRVLESRLASHSMS